MNSIIGFCDLLAEEELTEQQFEYLDIIRESGKSLLNIINDILDLSKIESGKFQIEMMTCSLSKILKTIQALMRPKAQQKGVGFQVERCSDLPETIRSDPLRLQQCLINLLGNAIKFTDTGHVILRVRLEKTDLGNELYFEVEDTGIGIPADKQEAVFQPFIQADSSTTRQYGGTGLGLTITNILVQLLDGSISMVSEAGKGTTFTIVIPVEIVDSEEDFDPSHIFEAGTAEKAGGTSSHASSFSGKVLVAEDNLSNQHLIKAMLAKWGVTICLVDNGKKAVEMACQNQYDLIFMDMQMPVMNGYQATRELRSRGIKTPIVALTAHAMEEERISCIQAGCDDFISKPIHKEHLIRLLEEYLKPAEAKAGR